MTGGYVDWKNWQAARFGEHSADEARYFDWHLQRALGARALQPLSVLEIGFGNGNFMGWARARGHRLTGVEVSAELVERAQKAGIAATTSLQRVEAAAPFDLVIALDVLEHVPMAELPEFMRSIATRLQPDGRAIFRFPNAESPFGQWYQHGDLTHVSALGLSRMRQLAPSAGLQLVCHGERLPWNKQAGRRRASALTFHLAQRLFERCLRKMYRLDRGMDFSPNQLVVLSPVRTEPPP